MPYDWNGDYIPSKANKTTDILGQREIGGVGQLIYHPFRFKDYEMGNNSHECCAFPICKSGYEPIFPSDDSVSGKELLVSLCNLAKRIDDFENKVPKEQLIIEWCKENMHPYSIDFIYQELTEESFDINGFDAEMVAHDGIFSFEDFMKDLSKLYNTALFYEALEGVCIADEEPAYNLYKEGKYFEGLPFFEKYKLEEREIPDLDESPANGNIVEIMKLYNKYEEEHFPPNKPTSEFQQEPFAHYEELRNTLINLIPDFTIRLKVNPATNRLDFSADVNSVFDIAWFTLARMLSEDPAPEDKGKQDERQEGIMIVCRHCGDFLIRRNNRQEYCDKAECQKARNAKNQREFRRRKRIETAQNNKHKV
ncbi:MAG: hypothetical protein LUG83_03660 [Lachnospiraceae bacterium]|nr:hypothetical protein [Lachnospiraceae bacterium]